MAQQKYEVKEPPITIDVEQPCSQSAKALQQAQLSRPSALKPGNPGGATENRTSSHNLAASLSAAVKEEEEKEEERKRVPFSPTFSRTEDKNGPDRICEVALPLGNMKAFTRFSF